MSDMQLQISLKELQSVGFDISQWQNLPVLRPNRILTCHETVSKGKTQKSIHPLEGKSKKVLKNEKTGGPLV